MIPNRSKLVALITGFISIGICIIYLILISLLDSRSELNDFLSNLSKSIATNPFLNKGFYSS